MLSRNINQSDTFVVLIKIRLSASLLFTLTYARTPIHTHTLMQTHIYVGVCVWVYGLDQFVKEIISSIGKYWKSIQLVAPYK